MEERIGEIFEELTIEWRIKDFFSLSNECCKCYSSPTFTFAGESWHINIFPNGSYFGEYTEPILCRESSGLPITIGFSFALKTVNGKKYKEEYLEHSFKKCNLFGEYMWLRKSELLEKRDELVPSGTLTVICSLKWPQSPINPSKKCSSGSSKIILKDKVLRDYKELFLNKEECDVILIVKGQKFPAHKIILATRSPVFMSTFLNDMIEKETGVVNIEDCDPSSFSDFLCFLYCREIENISEENVFSLFTTADKYDVQDLREICLQFMKESICVDTFCDTIYVALLYTESELITLATEFFANNYQKIVESAQWKKYSDDNPTQTNEIVTKALETCTRPNELLFLLSKESIV